MLIEEVRSALQFQEKEYILSSGGMGRFQESVWDKKYNVTIFFLIKYDAAPSLKTDFLSSKSTRLAIAT